MHNRTGTVACSKHSAYGFLTRIHLRAFAAAAVVLACMLAPCEGAAQVANGTIVADIGSGTIPGTLPFDVPFSLSAPAPAVLREVRVWVGSKRDDRPGDWRTLCPRLQPPAGWRASLGGSGNTDVDPISGSSYINDSAGLARAAVTAKANAEAIAIRYLTLRSQYYADTPVVTEVAELRSTHDTAGDALRKAEEARAMAPAGDATAAQAVATAREKLKAAVAALQASKSVAREEQVAAARDERARALKRQDTVENALRLLRIDVPPTAAWSREGYDSVGTVVLDIAALAPNRDYTFCFQTVRKPTKEEAAMFAAKATEGVLKVTREYSAQRLVSAAELDALHAAFIAALPAVDSLELAEDATIFLRTVRQTHDDDARNNEISALYSAFRQRYFNIANRIVTANDDSRSLVDSLTQLVGRTTVLGALGRAGTSTEILGMRDSTLLAAGVLARRLASPPTWGALTRVAEGTLVLGDVAGRTVSRILSDTTLVEVPIYLQNLGSTARGLDGLRRLAEYVRTRPELLDGSAAEAADVDQLIADIDAVLRSLALQREDLEALARTLPRMTEEVQRLVANISTLDFSRISLRGTSATNYKTRASWHISLDGGILVAHDIRELVPYLGVNLYTRAVNKEAPLDNCWGTWDCYRRRVSLTLGVTATSVKQANRVEDLVGGRALFLGAGLRITDYLRLSAGSLIVKSYVDGTGERPRPHGLLAGTASLDVDIFSLLGKVADAIVPGF